MNWHAGDRSINERGLASKKNLDEIDALLDIARGTEENGARDTSFRNSMRLRDP